MFKGIDLQKFNDHFKCEDDCRQYLFDLKWKNGFACRKCGNNQFWKGQTHFHARCKQCYYDESVCANTIFHKLKIPLLKAFGMAFAIALNKKGMSSVELARQFGINQKSAWYFKRKAQLALSSAAIHEDHYNSPASFRSLDSILISHREPGKNGLQRLGIIVYETNDVENIKTKVGAKCFLPDISNKTLSNLWKGKFKESDPDIRMWNFKVWLTGIHHHCSFKYLEGYLNEFFFRYNNRHRRKGIWHQFMNYVVQTNPRILTINAA